MSLIFQIVAGIVLANAALAAWAGFRKWHSRRQWQKRLDKPSPQSPAHVYKPTAPGVQYDHEGVAINAVPGARQAAKHGLGMLAGVYLLVVLICAVMIGLFH
jgi:hypothetical protein